MALQFLLLFISFIKNWIGNPFVVDAEFGLEPAVYLRFRPSLPAVVAASGLVGARFCDLMLARLVDKRVQF